MTLGFHPFKVAVLRWHPKTLNRSMGMLVGDTVPKRGLVSQTHRDNYDLLYPDTYLFESWREGVAGWAV